MDDRILTALVLVLADQLRKEAESRGVQNADDYTQQAVRLIQEKQAGILALFGRRVI